VSSSTATAQPTTIKQPADDISSIKLNLDALG
jgi:hypothetical protein